MRLDRDAFAAIHDSPVPVIGTVRGAALGTGPAIAACCDLLRLAGIPRRLHPDDRRVRRRINDDVPAAIASMFMPVANGMH